MRKQEAMAALGAGQVVDVSALSSGTSAPSGGNSSSRKAAPTPANEPRVSLG